ncbi:hypothetical protein PAXINDRAFT_16570 [Paxillus involutus ATCC 200175]|uniref:CxC1-like cysteine cluster associated with KDZ transposases domain-containing protein n=1 Tax=Paxillus involutus ATCC 200175 TaxID=664439 RepID=A0A0C9T442_PAXIN|nr:hypothetical protein PAXINDRAFT_16570 [Paxillus involutus ATCC 200175]
MGLFPCAPVAPSLAVDLRVLQFVKTLFVRQTPNVTAWCEAVEVFLAGCGYTFAGKDNLRRQFNNAYHWYCVLVIQNDDHVSAMISVARPTARPQEEHKQPSDYLRARCPLCFGGNDWRQARSPDQLCIEQSPCIIVANMASRVDCIICMDACFTKKRSKNPCGAEGDDPPNPITSFFVPTEVVDKMESLAEQCCTRGHNGTGRVVVPDGNDDLVEEGMHVPVSVLDGCGQSFIAADERWKKASTQFFADTGLMALLCRHDRVLWLVNLTSAGEKQHYVLALLKQFITHIPNDMRVGFLYDIGCQIEHSWCKWKFFDDSILLRFQFGVSVFHAYGHQWPCQIIYHPRKREGFGLSDGEGCERLWSALKPLISLLRVSGYHQRLFVLNMQVRHLDTKSLTGFALWLSRRWASCRAQKRGVDRGLRDCGCDVGQLRAQWVAQVEHQTRPSPRQSKNKVDKEIRMILELEQLVKARAATISALEICFVANRITDFACFELDIADARAQYDKLSDMLLRRRAALGVSVTARL